MRQCRHQISVLGSSEPVEVLSELGAVLVVELSSGPLELWTASAVFNNELESNPFELTADILDEAAVVDELADSAEVLLVTNSSTLSLVSSVVLQRAIF